MSLAFRLRFKPMGDQNRHAHVIAQSINVPAKLIQDHSEACDSLRQILRLSPKTKFGNSNLPVTRSMRVTLNALSDGNLANAIRNVLLLRFFEKHLKEVHGAAPEIVRLLRKRLVSPTLSDYLGARCEIDIAASLVRNGHKPKKRERPDFEVPLSNGSVFIECSHAFLEAEKQDPILYKIRACIEKYGKKGYMNSSTALVIEATNLFYNSEENTHVESVELLRHEICRFTEEAGIGATLVLFHAFDNTTLNLSHVVRRYDSPQIGKRLLGFLNAHYGGGSVLIENWGIPARPA